jgi:hypothetical protein
MTVRGPQMSTTGHAFCLLMLPWLDLETMAPRIRDLKDVLN